MTYKYYKTMGELINQYVPFDDNEPYIQSLIHAYELGAKHYSESTEGFTDIYELNYELAEFDSSWEQEQEKYIREHEVN